MKRCLLLLCLLVSGAHAGPLALPAAPQTEYVQHLDARLPLQAAFTDDSGAQIRLADLFGNKPAVLALGYYHCPNLCSTLMDGVLQTLADVDLPPSSYRVIQASIDPTEDSELAARKKVSYQPMFGRHRPDIHLLTGSKRSIDALAQTAGFHYRYDPALRQYMHPAGFLIATKDGHISRYFMGVRFDPKQVRLALIEASSGRIGSPADRLLLMCSHYDPSTGRYSVTVMTIVRIVCLAVLALLAGWIWLHGARRRKEK